jgi:hypothetical protein
VERVEVGSEVSEGKQSDDDPTELGEDWHGGSFVGSPVARDWGLGRGHRGCCCNGLDEPRVGRHEPGWGWDELGG